MTTPEEYLQRVGLIVGDDISDGEIQPARTPSAAPEPPPLPASTQKLFALIAEQVRGPYMLEQLQAMHDASTIPDDTRCCGEGTEKWQPYSDLMA